VLRKYYDAVSKGESRPRMRTMGSYIKRMEELGVGQPKVLACLRQITNLHRNTLMHPEDRLTTEEAISLLGIVQSAITVMLPAIPNAPLSPIGAAIAGLSVPASGTS